MAFVLNNGVNLSDVTKIAKRASKEAGSRTFNGRPLTSVLGAVKDALNDKGTFVKCDIITVVET